MCGRELQQSSGGDRERARRLLQLVAPPPLLEAGKRTSLRLLVPAGALGAAVRWWPDGRSRARPFLEVGPWRRVGALQMARPRPGACLT
eukprot:2355869-Pyramimonas_sp.AAC.1